jgi:hypothetical protein
MKIALLGTGFGQAHAAVYAQRPDVDELIGACVEASRSPSVQPRRPRWTRSSVSFITSPISPQPRIG